MQVYKLMGRLPGKPIKKKNKALLKSRRNSKVVVLNRIQIKALFSPQ